MLLTLSTTHRPATDLGYLLHKNPARPQVKELAFGAAHVFYTEAQEHQCTAVLMLEVDPIALIRGRAAGGSQWSPSFSLGQYVNDRPYAATSFLSVAIAQVYGSALGGRSRERPELAETPIPLEARLTAVQCRGGEAFLRGLFEPLGYAVEAEQHPLDAQFPEWGEGTYFTVTLRRTARLSEVLSHLYVLIPVLDADKHYYVGEDEVAKLLRHGEGWLASHPEKQQIARRYLKRRQSLVRQALERLVVDEAPQADEAQHAAAEEEAAVERPLSLNEQRMSSVLSVLRSAGARSVLDLGCGEGGLLRQLLEDRQFEQIVGVDVSSRALEFAEGRLKLDRLPPAKAERIRLLQGSLSYRDGRLERGGLAGPDGFDAACLVEVIEHLDPPRLAAMERVVFGFIRPRMVILTTPNAEYNVNWASLPAGRFRHRDHRFEWTRAEFQTWFERVAGRFGYEARSLPIGPADDRTGTPTQMAVFERVDATQGTV
jgi:3' terminal RNA ribose 2'-O-methyltransferase Hen1